jgi:hypothetical protein
MTGLTFDISNKTNSTGIAFFDEPGLTKEGIEGRLGSVVCHGCR